MNDFSIGPETDFESMTASEIKAEIDRFDDRLGFAKKNGAEEQFIVWLIQERRRAVAELARRNGKASPAFAPRSAVELENLTDVGNGKRLAFLYGEDLHYSRATGWLVWDGKRFAPDETITVEVWAKETARAIYTAAAQCEDSDRRGALALHAKRSEAESRIKAMIAMARSESGIPVRARELDKDAMILNVANGTLDLRTGEPREHRREDLITKLAPVAYDPTAQCSTWYRFLERVTGENAELMWFLQRAVGYSLTADTREQVFLILYGTGSNGKSTFIKTVAAMLGDYARTTPIETLLVKRGNQISNDVARLAGARFVSAIEAEGGRKLAEALIKQLTGGDPTPARFMYKEFFEFTPTFKFWLAVNHKPKIRGTDWAIWRRVRLVPFTVTIPDAEQDRDLGEKLKAELPGILRWAVEGCSWWLRDGLGTPTAVKQATAEYRAEMDTIADFLADSCEIDPAAETTAKELYAAYAQWVDKSGEKPVSKKEFGATLAERGFTPDRNKANGRYWKGLRVVSGDAC